MPKPTLEDQIEEAIRDHDLAADKLNQCREALQTTTAIESANSREITKLKTHVAKLQTQVRELIQANSNALHPPTESEATTPPEMKVRTKPTKPGA